MFVDIHFLQTISELKAFCGYLFHQNRYFTDIRYIAVSFSSILILSLTFRRNIHLVDIVFVDIAVSSIANLSILVFVDMHSKYVAISFSIGVKVLWPTLEHQIRLASWCDFVRFEFKLKKTSIKMCVRLWTCKINKPCSFIIREFESQNWQTRKITKFSKSQSFQKYKNLQNCKIT